MPVHRCTSAALEDTVAAIEQSDERIVSVAALNDVAMVIVTYVPTRVRGGSGKETR
jgi:hypothetical protein